MEFFESVQGYIAVECPVCGVRLYFRPDQQGGKIVCEMCNEPFDIPKEIKVKPKKNPNAKPQRVAGYEVSEEEVPARPIPQPPREEESRDQEADAGEVDVAETDEPAENDPPPPKYTKKPKGEKPAAKRKDVFLLECDLCYNRMYPRVDQVGEQIACPDCGTVAVVPDRPAEKPRKPRPKPKPVDVTDEPPPERPRDDRLDRTGMRPMETNLPDPPEWTFFSGVVNFLWRGYGGLFWIVMTLSLWIVMSVVAVGWDVAGIVGVLLLSGLLSFAVLVALSYTASCFWAVMQDTANGGDEMDGWPELTVGERVGTLGGVAFSMAIALAMGYGVGHAASFALGDDVVVWGMLVTVWLLFPVLATSAMVNQSFTCPVSSMILGSLATLCWGWFLVYLQTGAMLLICVAAVAFSYLDAPLLTVFWSGPLFSAAVLISGRLYGRLIWRATAREFVDGESDVSRRHPALEPKRAAAGRPRDKS